MQPLLRVLKHTGAASPADVYGPVADRSGITGDERLQGDEGKPIYQNRIQFARQALIDAGLLIGPSDPRWQRGTWELSNKGIALAAAKLTDGALEARIRDLAAEGARERAKARKESRLLAGLEVPEPGTDRPSNEEAPRESPDGDDKLGAISDLVDEANEVAMRTMLEHVRSLGDRRFEYLVGTVLKAALRAESMRVTRRSKDGGIDGILSLDALGMRTAVFEAKRYAEDTVVQRPQIDAFTTAARRHKADHSLFVTSSRFSTGAVAAGKTEGIRLIDGTAFVELMARHGVGLRERESFVVYEIDPTWVVVTEDDD